MIHEVEGRLTCSWNPEVRAIIDTWTSYAVTLEEFREAVLVKGLDYAKAHRGVAWIVDSSQARGAFTQEIQAFIGTDVFPAFARNGIKFFITITSTVSAITKLVVSTYSSKVEGNSMKLVEVGSVEKAIEWLRVNG
jgi:hypothetical protein